MTAPRVRFAPSPTGYLHIGGARTALFNWLYARRFGGKFILRMEDTDRERSTQASVQAILDGLTWLGIDWDEGPGKGGPFGPYFQTERVDTYKKHADQLIAAGKAYRCYCTMEELKARREVAEKQKRQYKYEGTCRNRTDQPDKPFVVRFKMPSTEGSVGFNDLVNGQITKTYDDLDDWVMLRADGIPLYNYGCVLDDHLMDITLVVRGQEHINSTFPQLMLYQALGWTPPKFAHLPLILGPNREKLSKRLHPEADVMLHKKEGILPEALLNYIVRLGWSHGNDEVISREQMTQWFDFDHVGNTSGVWDPAKLKWINEQWLKTLPVERVANELKPFVTELGITATDAQLQLAVKAFRERAASLKEMAEKAAPYLKPGGVTFDEKAATKFLTADSKPHLLAVQEKLKTTPAIDAATVDGWVKEISEKASVGMGKVAQPLRVAVTGGTVSPGIGDTVCLIGREESLKRLEAAIAKIG
ncbi:MAG: glutamate--tRNA ligase [Deltaproteobacteria bacterium]|nr:glutamate--tRNA ligase [Deltaproteobacteria bacterium]